MWNDRAVNQRVTTKNEMSKPNPTYMMNLLQEGNPKIEGTIPGLEDTVILRFAWGLFQKIISWGPIFTKKVCKRFPEKMLSDFSD